MARDFIFRIKPGEALPPRDPSGSRIIFNEQTRKFEILGADGSVVDLVSESEGPIISGDGVSNHSQLILDDGTNPHGTTAEDIGLGIPGSALQNALDKKLEISEDSARVGPNQEYKSIQEAIDDNKKVISVVEDMIEPSDVIIPFTSPPSIEDFVIINIALGVTLDMGDNSISILEENMNLRVSCQGKIIWTPQSTKNLFNHTETSGTGAILIHDIELDMSQTAAPECKITHGFFTNAFFGVHVIDVANHPNCGYQTTPFFQNIWNNSLIILRNLVHTNPANIHNVIDINGDSCDIQFVGHFNNSTEPVANIYGRNVNIRFANLSNSEVIFDLILGSINYFRRDTLVAGATFDVRFNMLTGYTEIKNAKLDIMADNSVININNTNYTLLENVSAHSIINANSLTSQINVIDLSFSNRPYNRNLEYQEVTLQNDLSISTTDMTSITELSTPLEPGWYTVELVPFYDISDNSFGTGWDFGGGTAVLSDYSFRGQITNTSFATFFRNWDSPDFNFTTTNTPRQNNNRSSIFAEFQVMSPGTLIPRFRAQSNDVSLTLKRGTFMKVKKLNI